MQWWRNWRERRFYSRLEKARVTYLAEQIRANPPLSPSYEEIAARLAEVVAPIDSDEEYLSLTEQQRDLYTNWTYIDEVMRSGPGLRGASTGRRPKRLGHLRPTPTRPAAFPPG